MSSRLIAAPLVVGHRASMTCFLMDDVPVPIHGADIDRCAAFRFVGEEDDVTLLGIQAMEFCGYRT